MGAPAVVPRPTSAFGELQVFYVDMAGEERRGPLGVLWNVGFEDVRPVRSFGSFRGQRSFQGHWWFATTGDHVGFESWLECDQVMLCDFDRDVVGLSSQPFWLCWRDEVGALHRRIVVMCRITSPAAGTGPRS